MSQQPLTLAMLEAALRSVNAVGQSAMLLSGAGCGFTIHVADKFGGSPIAVTGHGADLDAAAIDALRKCGHR